jgi:hypothetical protein
MAAARGEQGAHELGPERAAQLLVEVARRLDLQ